MTTSVGSATIGNYSPHEVLGRFLMAIRTSDLADVPLNYWVVSGGIVLEWIDGPTVEEARLHLLEIAIDSDRLDLHPDDLELDMSRPQDYASRVYLVARGVVVEFRHLAPIGTAAAVTELAPGGSSPSRRALLRRRCF